MIQRIQSLFLLGAVLLCVILIYVPVYELIPETVNVSTDNSSLVGPVTTTFTIFNSPILVITNAVIGAFALIAIFLFKNRNLQIRLTNLALVIDCILIGLLFFAADTSSSTYHSKVHYLYGSYIPVIMAIFLFVAIRYIKRDENLVRSADRLR